MGNNTPAPRFASLYEEISTRIEAKVKHSELDKLRIYVSIFREVLSKVDGSE